MIVDFDPVAFRVFGWPIHWYGLMYLIGFTSSLALIRYRIAKKIIDWKPVEADDLLFFAGLGAIVGGRIGFKFFYNFNMLLDKPLSFFRIWEGGMSFHGGLIGVMIGLWFFNRKYKKGYFNVLDFIALYVPISIMTVRFGNFLNGELWGKVSDVPWAMVFPTSGSNLPRHPSPLYECLSEGVLLFIILWFYSSKPRPTMAISGVFGIGYGTARFMIEFVRVPDAHIGYLAFGWVTMGQVLTIPIILAGAAFLWLAYHPMQLKKT